MADGRTKYMSELETGDEIAILSSSRYIETAVVGRLKIEMRPLLVVRFEISGEEGQTVVQQAETVRFVSPTGKAVSVTDACLLYTSPSPRDQRGSRMPSSA